MTRQALISYCRPKGWSYDHVDDVMVRVRDGERVSMDAAKGCSSFRALDELADSYRSEARLPEEYHHGAAGLQMSMRREDWWGTC